MYIECKVYVGFLILYYKYPFIFCHWYVHLLIESEVASHRPIIQIETTQNIYRVLGQLFTSRGPGNFLKGTSEFYQEFIPEQVAGKEFGEPWWYFYSSGGIALLVYPMNDGCELCI